MPGARADLEHHLDVEVRARLEALRLEQLARGAQLGEPLRQLGANELDRALERRPLRDEVLRRIDRRALEGRDRLAGEHVDLRDALDLVAPHLDADALLLVRREDLDRVAAHAKRSALERRRRCGRTGCAPASGESRRGRSSGPVVSVTICSRYDTGSPRP